MADKNRPPSLMSQPMQCAIIAQINAGFAYRQVIHCIYKNFILYAIQMKLFNIYFSILLFLSCHLCVGQNNALQTAENDPDAFLVLLEEKISEVLLKQTDKYDLSSLDKFDKFVDKIKNVDSRTKAKNLIKDFRENYSSDWHQRYPVKLSTRWHEIKGNTTAKKDTTEYFRLSGATAMKDQDEVFDAMAAKKGIALTANVEYLDPIDQALSKSGDKYQFKSVRIASKNRIESPSLPLDTFFYYSFDVNCKKGQINRVIFVVDAYDRVIAIQELIESPNQRKLHDHNRSRSVYNFIQMRRKGVGSYKIAYKATDRGGTTRAIQMESELLDTKGKPREWVKLYIPLHMAKVCLFCSQTIQD